MDGTCCATVATAEFLLVVCGCEVFSDTVSHANGISYTTPTSCNPSTAGIDFSMLN